MFLRLLFGDGGNALICKCPLFLQKFLKAGSPRSSLNHSVAMRIPGHPVQGPGFPNVKETPEVPWSCGQGRAPMGIPRFLADAGPPRSVWLQLKVPSSSAHPGDSPAPCPRHSSCLFKPRTRIPSHAAYPDLPRGPPSTWSTFPDLCCPPCTVSRAEVGSADSGGGRARDRRRLTPPRCLHLSLPPGGMRTALTP